MGSVGQLLLVGVPGSVAVRWRLRLEASEGSWAGTPGGGLASLSPAAAARGHLGLPHGLVVSG